MKSPASGSVPCDSRLQHKTDIALPRIYKDVKCNQLYQTQHYSEPHAATKKKKKKVTTAAEHKLRTDVVTR